MEATFHAKSDFVEIRRIQIELRGNRQGEIIFHGDFLLECFALRKQFFILSTCFRRGLFVLARKRTNYSFVENWEEFSPRNFNESSSAIEKWFRDTMIRFSTIQKIYTGLDSKEIGKAFSFSCVQDTKIYTGSKI